LEDEAAFLGLRFTNDHKTDEYCLYRPSQLRSNRRICRNRRLSRIRLRRQPAEEHSNGYSHQRWSILTLRIRPSSLILNMVSIQRT
jgi:hypothetical protein